MKTPNKLFLLSCRLIFCGLLILVVALSSAKAQEPEVTLSGLFSIVWGDSDDGRTSTEYTLTDESGNLTVLQLDETVLKQLGGVLQFNRKLVTVDGILIPFPGPFSVLGAVPGSTPVLKVKSISLSPSAKVQPLPSSGISVLAAVSGSHPWVTIMCKFSDITDEPENTAYFQGMYGDAYPGLNHYWRELSFDTANITGSDVGGAGWYDLPNTELHYNPTDTEKGTNRTLLAQECIDAVDADVDFSGYSGINMMFNSNFDNGWAWGGSWNDSLDGVTKTWSITWEPPWGYRTISVISHEMGHGFGLPHSSFDRSAVYDNPWDVMSDDRYNCAAATDPTYGCIAQHTIAYYKDILEWIPAARIGSLPSGHDTVILEDLAAPASSNFQMITIPIGGSATNFYTLEARRFTGYDSKLPEEAVVIHNVDTTDGIPAVLVPDAAITTDAWTVGETFIDPVNSIAAMVLADTGTGFQIRISNGNLPPASEPGGPYTAECNGANTTVSLDGTGSSDPDGDTITYLWSTSCDGGFFDDNTASTPTLTVNINDVCNYSCDVTLTVADDKGLESFDVSTLVNILDTTSPSLVDVPGNTTVECDSVPEPAEVSATDDCDTEVIPDFLETREDGSCIDNYSLTRTWTAIDDCGNSSIGEQVVTVQDTIGPVISCNNPATIVPPDAPISFTATASDNCAEESPAVITGYDCFKFTKKGKIIDKKESCIVELSGDTITIVDSGGVDDNITWSVSASDNCGNVTETDCSVLVVNPGKNK